MPRYIVTKGRLRTVNFMRGHREDHPRPVEAVMIDAAAPQNAAWSAGEYFDIKYNDRIHVYTIGGEPQTWEFVVTMEPRKFNYANDSNYVESV